MSLELLFLGTGTSAGVPMIACPCPVCHSADPRDQRTRPSVLIRYPALDPSQQSITANPDHPPRLCQWLVDTTPDMRAQVLRHRIDRIDGVFLTHSHADHVFGLDDLRRFNVVMDRPIDLYAEQSTINRLRTMFYYIFEPHKNENHSFVANLIPRDLQPGTPLHLAGATWTPLRLLHGKLPILGFRVDYPAPIDHPLPLTTGPASDANNTYSPPTSLSLAYCTDVSRFPPETYPLLQNLDVLVLDALRYRHHPTHMTVEQALSVIDHVKPRRAYLTHIAHDILHAHLQPQLPPNVFLAFDGLTVTL